MPGEGLAVAGVVILMAIFVVLVIIAIDIHDIAEAVT
jgi:hypothetical protein